jgi:hypothetical protein
MEVKILKSQIEFFETEEEFVSSPNDEVVIAVLEQTEVIYNGNSECNLEYCNIHGIKAYEGKIDTIGTGVVTKGSIVLTVKKKMINGGEALSDSFAKALSQYLIKKGLPSVRQDNNDVLVADGKVASGGEIIINGFNYMGFQISINQDVEAIENICYKHSVKKPKALSDFGVSTDEIVEFCKNYFIKI